MHSIRDKMYYFMNYKDKSLSPPLMMLNSQKDQNNTV